MRIASPTSPAATRPVLVSARAPVVTATLRRVTLVALAAGLPLVFNPFGTLAFEPFKMALLRLSAGAILVTFAVDLWLGATGEGETFHPGEARPLVLAAAALLVATTIATIFSLDPLTSLLGSYHRLQGLVSLGALMVVGLAASREEAPGEHLLDCLLLGSGLVCLYALLQLVKLDPLPWLDRTLGPASTIGSSTGLGDFLAMLVPVSLARAAAAGRALRSTTDRRAGLAGREVWRFAHFLGLAGLQVIVIFASGVRGALLGLGTGLGVLALLLIASGVGRGKLGLLLALLGGGLAGTLALNVPGTPLGGLRGASPYVERLGQIGPNEASGRERLLIWRAALDSWSASGPRVLVGLGPETQPVALEGRFPLEIASRLPDQRFDRVHDESLDALLTTGILGLGSQIALLLAAGWVGWRVLQRASEPWLLAALLAALAASVTANTVAFDSASTLLVFWLALGMLARLGRGRGPTPDEHRKRPGWTVRRGLPIALACLVVVLILVSVSPVLADVAYSRGLAYRGGKDVAGEVAWTRRAAGLAPDRELYAVALGLALAREAAAEQSAARRASLLAEAEGSLRRAVARAPAEPYAYFHLGQVLEMRAEAERVPSARTQAVAAYDQAAQQSPQRAVFLDAAGFALQQDGRPEEALDRYRQATELDGPQAERAARIGDCLLELGRVGEARSSYLAALRLAPRSALAHAGLSRLLHREGDLAGAIEQARLAARFQFRDWRYREALARLEQEAGRQAEALVEARAAVRFAPPWEQPRLRGLVAELRNSR